MKSDFMLTGKDLLYIEDCIDQSAIIYKRISFLESNIQDKDVKDEYTKIKNSLKKETERLLSIIEKEVNNA